MTDMEKDKRIAALSEQLEHDRTLVADCITVANRALDSRHWLTEGRGSYEWDDNRWQSEFRAAGREIKAALAPMTRVAADWNNCPRKTDEVAAARIDLHKRITALEAQVQHEEAVSNGLLIDKEELAAHCERLKEALAPFAWLYTYVHKHHNSREEELDLPNGQGGRFLPCHFEYAAKAVVESPADSLQAHDASLFKNLLVRCSACGGTVLFKQESKEITFFHSCWKALGQATVDAHDADVRRQVLEAEATFYDSINPAFMQAPAEIAKRLRAKAGKESQQADKFPEKTC